MLRMCPKMTSLGANCGVWDFASTANTRDVWTPPADQLFIAAGFPIPIPASPSIRACQSCNAPATRRRI